MRLVEGGKGKDEGSILTFGSEPDEDQNFMIGMVVGEVKVRLFDMLAAANFDVSQMPFLAVLALPAAEAKLKKIATWMKLDLDVEDAVGEHVVGLRVYTYSHKSAPALGLVK